MLGIIAAIILYIIRARCQRCYGMIEIITGIFLLFLSVQVSGSFSNDFSSDFDVVRSTVTLMTYLGAIFAVARGLDNVTQSYRATKATTV